MPGMTALSVNVDGTASRRDSDPQACSKTPTTSADAIRASGNDFKVACLCKTSITPARGCNTESPYLEQGQSNYAFVFCEFHARWRSSWGRAGAIARESVRASLHGWNE